MQIPEPPATFLADELAGRFDPAHLFEQLSELPGETFREVEGRRTFRFELSGKAYFAKVHSGIGWSEVWKNLVTLRLPILGARNEYLAALRLTALGIPTLEPVAFADEPGRITRRRSCIVTREISNAPSLEDLVNRGELTNRQRRLMVGRVAEMTRTMHEHGINHRDLYICHFLCKQADSPELALIDLHRAQIRRGRAPMRWREKDVAALLFSAADAGLTRTDIARFVRIYSAKKLKQALQSDAGFWRRVLRRANRLYQRDHGRSSPLLERLAS